MREDQIETAMIAIVAIFTLLIFFYVLKQTKSFLDLRKEDKKISQTIERIEKIERMERMERVEKNEREKNHPEKEI